MLGGSVGIVGAAVALAWALFPVQALTTEQLDRAALSNRSAESVVAAAPRHTLDASSFEVRLWNAPVQPESPTASKDEPSAPPNLELIAIITETDRLVAALYEVGADRLHMVTTGDRIGRLEIRQVDARGVDLRDGSRSFRLSLTPSPVEPGTRLTLGQSEGVQP